MLEQIQNILKESTPNNGVCLGDGSDWEAGYHEAVSEFHSKILAIAEKMVGEMEKKAWNQYIDFTNSLKE